MPKVGQKRFAYTPAGKKAAAKYAKKKGKKVKKTTYHAPNLKMTAFQDPNLGKFLAKWVIEFSPKK